MVAALRNVIDLSPTDFENFTYDLLQSSGMRQLVWRTPGADGGRDIEGEVFQADISGHIERQRWYIECKRYSTRIDWPTVWKKLSYADSNSADFLLLVTNSNPSPQCETHISTWNTEHRAPKIRVWRGYEIDALLNAFPVIAVKYGLRHANMSLISDFLDLGFEISKISDATYVSYELGLDVRPGLEASAALSALFSRRINDLVLYGRFAPTAHDELDSLYDWLGVDGRGGVADEVAIRATACTLKYVTRAQRLFASLETTGFSLIPITPRQDLNDAAIRLMKIVGMWANLDFNLGEKQRILYSYR